MSKRYQIFVSSTYEDLIGERNQVIEAVLNMGHIPVGMEMFSADDEDQWATIKREIDRSDYYLLIVAHRYGSTIKSERGISYTEKEFNYAIDSRVPRIAFVIKKGATWNPEYVDKGPILKKLEAFKSKVRGKPVDFWMDAPDLGRKVAIALPKLIANSPRPGWERSTTSGAQVAATMSRLVDENAQLRAEVEQLRALAGDKVPIIECKFALEEEGFSVDVLQTSPPRPLSIKEFAISYLEQVDLLTSKVDALQRQSESSSSHRTRLYTTSPSSTFTRKYNFSEARLRRVKSALKSFGAASPSKEWKFQDLKADYVTAIGISYQEPEPSLGTDIEKYKAFASLEDLLASVESALELYNYAEKNLSVKLQITNTNRVPAENLTVRLTFPAGTHIGDFEFNRQQKKNWRRTENISKTSNFSLHKTR